MKEAATTPSAETQFWILEDLHNPTLQAEIQTFLLWYGYNLLDGEFTEVPQAVLCRTDEAPENLPRVPVKCTGKLLGESLNLLGSLLVEVAGCC